MMKSFHLHNPVITDEPIRLLMIGAGKMGRAHTAAFKTISEVDIVGIVSGGGERARELATAYGISRWGTSWQDLADETDPHACVIAVPSPVNETITCDVIEYGLHFLAEKPVALNSKTIRALAHKAKERGLIGMAAVNRRFYPTVTAALDLVRFYGPVVGVTVMAPDPVRPYHARQHHAPLIYQNWTRTNTIHAIDLLRLIGGEVEALSGAIHMHEAIGERSIASAMQFCSGSLGSFLSYSSHAGKWELRIHGDGVEAHLMPLEQGAMKIGQAAPFSLPKSDATDGLKPGLKQQAMAVVESLRYFGEVRPPASDLFDHARTMDLVEQILALPLVGCANVKTSEDEVISPPSTMVRIPAI
jgi:predicted dehydrogenase